MAYTGEKTTPGELDFGKPVGATPNAKPDFSGDDEFQTILRREIEDAKNFMETDVAPARAKAIKFYKSEAFGDEEEGRSKFILSVLRDTVQAMLPSQMRIFFGAAPPVEFVATKPEQIEQAKQATDYARHIIAVDNPGFLLFHGIFKDAFYQKAGVVKYWFDDSEVVDRREYTGLGQEELMALAVAKEGEMEVSIEPPAEEGAEPTFGVELVRKHKRNRVKYACVPPEEWGISRDGRTFDDATLVYHQRNLPVTDLVAMGYDKDEMMKVSDAGFTQSAEQLERDPSPVGINPAIDPMMRPILYTEAFIKTANEKGLPVLKKACCVGPQYQIVKEEIVDERPFAAFVVDPEAHTFISQDIADRTMDLQRTESLILRECFNSLAQSMMPTTEVVEGQVRMEDVMKKEVGKIVRVRGPGMYIEHTTPFVGDKAFPVLQFMEGIKEDRVGVSQDSNGLDADTLQSTTKDAAVAVLKNRQQQAELIARLFAETGMTRLMRGILKLVIRHQDKPRMIRLRGQFVPMDPRDWDADMDLTVKVGLGNGNTEERTGLLTAVLGKQEALMQTLGPSNPLVGLPEYRNTIAELMALGGYADDHRFFKPIDPNWQPPQPPPPQAPPPDPAAMAMVEVEKQKAETAAKAKEAELQLKAKQQEHDQAMAQQQHAQTAAENEARISSEHQSAQDRIHNDAAIAQAKLESDVAIAREKIALDERLAIRKMELDAEVKREAIRSQPATSET